MFSFGLPIFKSAKAHYAKIKELDLASLGTQTASIFTLHAVYPAASGAKRF